MESEASQDSSPCSKSRPAQIQCLMSVYPPIRGPERQEKTIPGNSPGCWVIHGSRTNAPIRDPGKVQPRNKAPIWNPVHTFSPAVPGTGGPFSVTKETVVTNGLGSLGREGGGREALHREGHCLESGTDTNTLGDWFRPQWESIGAHLVASRSGETQEPVRSPSCAFFSATYSSSQRRTAGLAWLFLCWVAFILL